MSNPSRLNPSPPVAENGSLPRASRKLRPRRRLIGVLFLVGVCILGWWLIRPSLVPLGVRTINGHDFFCFRVRNETTDEAAIQVHFVRDAVHSPASYALISASERGLWKWCEIGIPTDGVRELSNGKPIRILVQIWPRESKTHGQLRRFLGNFVPVRFLETRVGLYTEPFLP